MPWEAYALLFAEKDKIEAVLGELEWQELPDGKDCRIELSRGGDSKNKNQWPELHLWMKQKSEAFYDVFSPIIKSLDL